MIHLDTELHGGGTLVNQGIILPGPGGSVTGVNVTDHDYVITYTVGGTSITKPASQTVYAATFSLGGVTLPSVSPHGWSTSGAQPVTNITDLATLFGERAGATSVTLYPTSPPAPPTITSFTPPSASSLGGTYVTIRGTHLTDAELVEFGSTYVTFHWTTPTAIVATAPPHAAGLVTVSVTTPGGTATKGGFRFTTGACPPHYSGAYNGTVTGPSGRFSDHGTISYSSVTGAATFSGHLTVTGTGTVAISGSESCAGVTFGTSSVGATFSGTSTPNGFLIGGTWHSSSLNESGTFALRLATPKPEITSITSLTATGTGSSQPVVQVIGSKLYATSLVKFGTTPAASYSVTSPTALTVTAPHREQGRTRVTVTTPGGSTTYLWTPPEPTATVTLSATSPTVDSVSSVPEASIPSTAITTTSTSTGGSVQGASVTASAAALRTYPLRTGALRTYPLRTGGLGSAALRTYPAAEKALSDILLSDLPIYYPAGCSGTTCTGWAGVLAGTPYATDPLDTVTLTDVLSNPTALARFNSVPLGDLDVSSSSLGSLPLISLALAGLPLTSITPTGSTGSATGNLRAWCAQLKSAGFTCHSDFGVTQTKPSTAQHLDLLALGLSGVPVDTYALRTYPLRTGGLESTPLRTGALRTYPLRTGALRTYAACGPTSCRHLR